MTTWCFALLQMIKKKSKIVPKKNNFWHVNSVAINVKRKLLLTPKISLQGISGKVNNIYGAIKTCGLCE